jgi:hypothetical protein
MKFAERSMEIAKTVRLAAPTLKRPGRVLEPEFDLIARR